MGELLIKSFGNTLSINACNGLLRVCPSDTTQANNGFYKPAINEIRFPELPGICFMFFNCLLNIPIFLIPGV